MQTTSGKIDPISTSRVFFEEPFWGAPSIIVHGPVFIYDVDEWGFSFKMLKHVDGEIAYGARFDPPRLVH